MVDFVSGRYISVTDGSKRSGTYRLVNTPSLITRKEQAQEKANSLRRQGYFVRVSRSGRPPHATYQIYAKKK